MFQIALVYTLEVVTDWDERGDYVNTGTVEIQQRAQYSAWLRLMSAEG